MQVTSWLAAGRRASYRFATLRLLIGNPVKHIGGMVIIKAARALLFIGEVVIHLEILSWCSGAISNTLEYFDEEDSIAMVNQHFALTVWDHGILIAICTGILIAIAGFRNLIERASTLHKTHDIVKRNRIAEERIGWVLLLAIPMLTYAASLIFRAEEGPVFAAANRQIPIVWVGFILMMGVDFKLIRIGITRGKSNRAEVESVNA